MWAVEKRRGVETAGTYESCRSNCEYVEGRWKGKSVENNQTSLRPEKSRKNSRVNRVNTQQPQKRKEKRVHVQRRTRPGQSDQERRYWRCITPGAPQRLNFGNKK